MLQNGKLHTFLHYFIITILLQFIIEKYIIIMFTRFQDTMVAVIGQRNAEISLTTGKMYTSDEALKIGLIDENVPDADTALKNGIQFLNTFKNISRE